MVSRRLRRLLTGQPWYRWPKDQLTPLLYHALARAKSTFSNATRRERTPRFLSDPTGATRRVAGHRKASAGFIIDAMAPILFPARDAVPRALSTAIGDGAAA